MQTTCFRHYLAFVRSKSQHNNISLSNNCKLKIPTYIECQKDKKIKTACYPTWLKGYIYIYNWLSILTIFSKVVFLCLKCSMSQIKRLKFTHFPLSDRTDISQTALVTMAIQYIISNTANSPVFLFLPPWYGYQMTSFDEYNSIRFMSSF